MITDESRGNIPSISMIYAVEMRKKYRAAQGRNATMKIGLHINAVSYTDRSWEEVCVIARKAGLNTLEPGSGGFVGKNHCNPKELLDDRKKLKSFLKALQENRLEISALSCHGNPLHPDVNIARAHADDLDTSILLASRIGVKTVNCFAGSPGLDEDARCPSWITIRWPEEFEKGLKWQWEKRIIPFWRDRVKKARKAGIQFGFEMHPGDSVFNPPALLRLREAVGAEEICCNLDPSHLFWQGINPIAVIERLGAIIVHVHAKDTQINESVKEFKGVFSEALFGDLDTRAWTFRVVGEGHGVEFWKSFVKALKKSGYEGVLSIEHEDPCIPIDEGLTKASKFLKAILSGNSEAVLS
jgi:sugar phosphate isomerase/epimerase